MFIPQDPVVTTKRTQKIPPTPAPVAKSNAWEIPPIECYEPDDGVFYAQLGPTGGKHGYEAITGNFSQTFAQKEFCDHEKYFPLY